MTKKIWALPLLLTGINYAQPPYQGTIFDFPDSFNDEDPTALVDVQYVGRESKNVYDRRANYITINAYIFSASFNDGSPDWEIIVNPEFNQETATELAEKYSFNIGQMPICIREGVSGAVIHDGDNPWGGGDPLTIHHGQGLSYENQGIVTETMIHESTHAEFDRVYYNEEWQTAVEADGNYISTYARDYPDREDHSESFLCWLVVRYKAGRVSQSHIDKISSAIPNRLAFYDNQDFKLTPVVGGNTDLAFNNGMQSPFTLRYNPLYSTLTTSYNLEKSSWVSLQILDMQGRVVSTLTKEWTPPGNYRKVWAINGGSQRNLVGGSYVFRLKAGDFEGAEVISRPR